MISQNAIMVSAPIALSLQEKDTTVLSRCADFVGTLCEVSAGAAPLTPENVAVELPKATEAGSDHGVLQGESIKSIANGVNNAFLQIRQYLRPVDVAITSAIRNVWNPTNAVTQIHNRMGIAFVELDHPFFHSALFPTNTPDGNYDYDNFELRHLTTHRRCFPTLEKEKLQELLISSNDELNDMIDWEDIRYFYENYFVDCAWGDMFAIRENKTIDLRDPEVSLKALIHLYIIASRLNVEDTVLEGVQRMGLDDYRGFIRTILNVVVFALQQHRQTMMSLAQQKLPIIKLRLDKEKGRQDTLRGHMRVGVTDEAIAEAEAKGAALSEILIGYAYARFSNENGAIPAPLDNVEEYVELYKQYVAQVRLALVDSSEKTCREAVEKALIEFQKNHPELLERIPEVQGQLDYRRLLDAMQPHVDMFVERYKQQVVQNGADENDFLATPFITIKLADLLGMTFSAQILSRTHVTTKMTVEEQRHQLAVATAEAIVSLCFGNHL